LSPTSGQRLANSTHVVYQGGFGYRYPYDVTLSGCSAGTLPGVRAIRREQQEARERSEQLRRDTRGTEEYRKLNQENQSLHVQMRYEPDPKLVAQQRKIDRDISEIPRQEIETAKEAAAAETNALEAQLLRKTGPSGQLASISRKILGGNVPHVPDDIEQIKSAKELQSLPWPTTVDWDGRARYESDKEAMAQPVMQHYLKRMKPWMYK
jgi:hypothetical protein